MIKTLVVDRIVFVLVVVATILSGIFVYASPQSAQTVEIEAAGVHWTYPLNVDRIVTVRGSCGDTVVEICGSSVRIIESCCPNHTCVSRGAINRTSSILVCLPNEVCISIAGSSVGNSHSSEFDAVSE